MFPPHMRELALKGGWVRERGRLITSQRAGGTKGCHWFNRSHRGCRFFASCWLSSRVFCIHLQAGAQCPSEEGRCDPATGWIPVVGNLVPHTHQGRYVRGTRKPPHLNLRLTIRFWLRLWIEAFWVRQEAASRQEGTEWRCCLYKRRGRPPSGNHEQHRFP